MNNAKEQFDFEMCGTYSAGVHALNANRMREAVIARANRLYIMGELALAAALLLELAS